MKKFSNITKQKVNEEPKVEVKIDEAKIIRTKLISLMNQLLSIQFHGSNDYRIMNSGSKIHGQEMLAEAIMDFLSEKNIKEQTKLLESLKSQIGDWQVIDKKIEEINTENNLLSNKIKINSILEKYSDDNESLIMVIEKKVSKITNIKTLKDYSSLISESSLPTEVKNKLNSIYEERIKLLL